MHGKITVSYMTEEERLAYIEKHPIKSSKKKRKSAAFSNIHAYGDRVKKKKS